MSKQRLFIILFTISVFFISLFLTMPAQKAYQWGLFSNISMQGVSGRYVSGKTKQLKVDKTTIAHLTWAWQPLSLLMGKVSLNWNINDKDIMGKGVLAMNLLQERVFSDVDLVVNGKVISPYLPKGNSLSGDIELDIELVKFSEKLQTLSLVAKAESLSITTALGVFELENSMLAVMGNELEGFNLQLTDYKSRDAVDILIHIKGNKITLSGQLASDSIAATKLSALLPLIAKKQGRIWQLNWQGSL